MNTALNYQPEVLVDTADLSREDWLDYRRLGIGGSDAAAIMGLSPFSTIRDLYFDSFGKNKVFRELMTFLSPFHVTPKKANMILQKFRDQSVEIIRKQPYILCSVKGFGFLTVDAIARQCCAATNDPMRISGCVSYVLREAMKQNGHLYLEQEILVKDALKVLNKELNLQPVTETEILKVLYKKDFETSLFLRIAMETGIRSADIPCIEWSCMHGKTIILEETKRGDLYKKVNGTFPKISTQSLRIMKLLHRKQGKIFTKSNEYYVRKISCAWGMPGFRIHSFRDYRRKIEMGITAGVQVPRIIPL